MRQLYYEGIVEDITERKRAEEAEREFVNRVVAAQEEEQRRIARELHDHTTQSLTALIFGLKALELQGSSQDSDLLSKLQQIAADLSRDIRTLATRVRPPALDGISLHSALSNYVADWSELSKIGLDFHCNGLLNRRLPPHIETTVYRVVQEALTNVFRHAHAKNVSVIVECRRGRIRAIIEDDGAGFETNSKVVPSKKGGLGLLGMCERANLVKGTVSIESNKGSGTTVILQIPIPPTYKS